jgi:hypothetical protein
MLQSGLEEVSAQGAAQLNQTPGVTRKLLSRTDGPLAGYEIIVTELTLEPNVPVARHTHPSIEPSYVMEGAVEICLSKSNPRAATSLARPFRSRRIRLTRAARLKSKKSGFSIITSLRRESRSLVQRDSSGGKQKPRRLELAG